LCNDSSDCNEIWQDGAQQLDSEANREVKIGIYLKFNKTDGCDFKINKTQHLTNGSSGDICTKYG